MNIVDRIAAKDILETPISDRETLISDFVIWLIDDMKADRERAVDEAMYEGYNEDDIERAFEEGKEEAKQEFEQQESNLKRELRELRRENKEVLRERVANLKADLEKDRLHHTQEMKPLKEENERMYDWGKQLRASLNKQSESFYRDMNKLLTEIRRLNKKNRMVRVVTMHPPEQEEKAPNLSGERKRWLQIDTEKANK